jgi:hypothetical protein
MEAREEKERPVKELARKRKIGFPNPLNTLRIAVEKDVALLLFIASLLVTAFQCLLTILPSTFKDVHGFNDLQIGLCYM